MHRFCSLHQVGERFAQSRDGFVFEEAGPGLGRPIVDTIKGSRHTT
jgi:hypothetical protein